MVLHIVRNIHLLYTWTTKFVDSKSWIKYRVIMASFSSGLCSLIKILAWVAGAGEGEIIMQIKPAEPSRWKAPPPW